VLGLGPDFRDKVNHTVNAITYKAYLVYFLRYTTLMRPMWYFDGPFTELLFQGLQHVTLTFI